MKRFFAILMTFCLMASVLSVTALPAYAVPDLFREVVISVRALKKDATLEVIDEFSDFDEGWNVAMDIAESEREMEDNNYDRIVVDLWADWNADDYGWFTDDILQGKGFVCRAIYFPEDARVTLNMNGHTINRGLTQAQDNGEVMFIAECADVIINDGTITGGFSENGAGGIHIDEDATVVLNNVNVTGNAVTADDGAGIAVYEDATLIMNRGSISNNISHHYISDFFNITVHPYGALYVNDATVVLNEVTFDGNLTTDRKAQGVAIYATDSTVTMTDCTLSGNAVDSNESENAESVIAAYDSKLILTNTNFTGNVSKENNGNTRLFYLEDSRLTMQGGKITGNGPAEVFGFLDSQADIKRVTITENASGVLSVNNDSQKVTMTECTLGNNTPKTKIPEILVATKGTLVMADCKTGDSTFNNKTLVEFSNGAYGRAMAASLFGEGSLAVIVTIFVLVVVVAFVGIRVASKKKTGSAAKNHTETDGEQ